MSAETSRYEIVRTLGSGGFGNVYLAKDRSDGRQVAVKKVMGVAAPPYLEREFRILSELSHPNVVKVYETFHIDGDLFFAMEKIDGRSLFEAIGRSRDGSLSDLGCIVFRQLINALDYVHHRRIVHGELAPSNLLVDAAGVLKIVDFEHSRRIDVDEAEYWPDGTVAGTPLYMSPEHLGGRLLVESDHFVVGVLIFEHVTGRNPLKAAGDSLELVFRNVMHPNPDWTDCAGDLVPILKALLNVTPAERASGWTLLQDFLKADRDAREEHLTVRTETSPLRSPGTDEVGLRPVGDIDQGRGSWHYDVAISFAGEQREQARAIADGLRNAGVRVFFDEYEQAILWGEDLYEHLAVIYQEKAQYCLMLVSRAYADKVWTSHERRHAQARALNEKRGYILPVRFDDTVVPGLPPTIGYINYSQQGPEGVCRLLQEKLSAGANQSL